ncbi:MAG UNVERIFIED_CONTAM: hypothetical protein LVT10_06120 [Anaerolineae bacterium]|jgi:hypothetical protein
MKSIRLHVWAYLFFVAMTLALLAPMLSQFNSHLIGAYESDAYEYSRHVWWYTYAFQTGQNPYWQSLLAYPDGLPANWMLTNPLQGFPAWLFAWVFPLPTAFNLVIMLWLSLNGWAMFYFVRRLLNGTHDPTVNSAHATLPPCWQGRYSCGIPAFKGTCLGRMWASSTWRVFPCCWIKSMRYDHAWIGAMLVGRCSSFGSRSKQ